MLAFVAIALHWMRAADRVLGSLSANAYGIYLVHYVFVLWLQYAVLGAGLNAFGKVGLVFTAALALSWITSGMLRTGLDVLLRRWHPGLPAKAVANKRR